MDRFLPIPAYKKLVELGDEALKKRGFNRHTRRKMLEVFEQFRDE